MRLALAFSLLAAFASSQAGPFGLFASAADIGAPPLKGSASFDPATRQYNVTGTFAGTLRR